ncbi:multicopper oxidase family protein [Methylobacter psychrophilus]|uniref:multicopper oxidase family protein n=1 Tax=Methylobacter psychrophilus TaxID=96941 RepID=UPI0021D51A87|nr:multicopper oxidase domain-containing protein [Methylobacter psychrophilus]
MFKKIIKATSFSQQEKIVERYMKEVNDIQAAGISRRELFKMGLTAGVGGLTTIGGGVFLPNLAQAASSSTSIISPPCNKPWTEPLPIPKTAVSVGNFTGPEADKGQCLEKQNLYNPGNGPIGDYEDFIEARADEHQRWDELGGLAACTKYELMAKEIDWNFYSLAEYPAFNSKVWTYVDMNSDSNGEFATGVLRLKAQYGSPVLMRMYNGLPKGDRDTQGFGINQCSPHLHNAHNPPESDGGPMRFFDSGKWWDYWYPNIRAGFASTHKTGTFRTDTANPKGLWCPGDWQETQSTLWFHDHRMDFTAQNVYKGMASFYTLFSKDINLDTDDETIGLRLPSGKYDIPLLFTDKVFDQTGQMFFDTFNIDGILGDQQTVNFKIKPYLTVDRRKYRFRFLDAGPSRYIELSLSNAAKFTRIANCGNLLPKAQIVSSIRLGVAERADVIIDFSTYKPGTVIYLENRLEQLNGKGTTGKILASSSKTQLLKFIVSSATVVDNSASLATLQTQVMVPMPDRTKNPIKIKRKFDFGTSNGAWNVNGKFFNPTIVSAYPIEGSQEEWTLTSPGGWSHPVHIHHEEFEVINRNGKAPAIDDLSRKDVVRIGDGAQGTAGTSSITFRMQFRDWIGDYPMHCHNVVHEDHAMMIRFKIVPPTDPNAGK